MLVSRICSAALLSLLPFAQLFAVENSLPQANILLIVTDDQRADTIHAHGNAIIRRTVISPKAVARGS